MDASSGVTAAILAVFALSYPSGAGAGDGHEQHSEASRPAPAPSVRPLISAVFADHAVLQRDRPIPVWGWASAGEPVTVSLIGAGVTHVVAAAAPSVTVSAGSDGRWTAQLPAQRAGGPYVLTVAAGGQERVIHDVLVGDVWLCSGQSNMELQVDRTLNWREEVAGSSNDGIRMATVLQTVSPLPQQMPAAPLEWQVAGPATAAHFSAACWYFARELQKSVPVPIGLINASRGSTNIQTWMDEQSLRSTSFYDAKLDVLSLYAAHPAEAQARWGALYEQWWREQSGERAGTEPWRADHFAPAAWHTAPPALGYWETWGVPELAAFDGLLWYRTTVKLDAQQASQGATLLIGPVDEVDQTWVNGRPIGNASGPDLPRAYALAPGLLHPGENVIVVAALDTYGYGGIYGPAEGRALRLADGTAVPLNNPWYYRIGTANVSSVPRAPWEPVAGLTMSHNAMIAPLVPYGLRGVLWYQGESNTGEAQRYETLLTGLMADWRREFNAPLTFLVVQLANYGPPATTSAESTWAELREAQRLTVAHDANSGLAVAVDIGDRYDIHPANKQEVGRRLARAARHVVYGEAIAPSGPALREARLEGSRVQVSFRDVDQSLVAYGAYGPIGFQLCGAEPSSCRFAEATLAGDHVVLEVPQGLKPARVRYCWADNPVCTLYDAAGLPAGPFERALQ